MTSVIKVNYDSEWFIMVNKMNQWVLIMLESDVNQSTDSGLMWCLSGSMLDSELNN